MKGASVHNNSRSQSQVLSFVSRQRTDTGILKRRKFFDTFKVSRQMTPIVFYLDLFSYITLARCVCYQQGVILRPCLVHLHIEPHFSILACEFSLHNFSSISNIQICV